MDQKVENYIAALADLGSATKKDFPKKFNRVVMAKAVILLEAGKLRREEVIGLKVLIITKVSAATRSGGLPSPVEKMLREIDLIVNPFCDLPSLPEMIVV